MLVKWQMEPSGRKYNECGELSQLQNENVCFILFIVYFVYFFPSLLQQKGFVEE